MIAILRHRSTRAAWKQSRVLSLTVGATAVIVLAVLGPGGSSLPWMSRLADTTVLIVEAVLQFKPSLIAIGMLVVAGVLKSTPDEGAEAPADRRGALTGVREHVNRRPQQAWPLFAN